MPIARARRLAAVSYVGFLCLVPGLLEGQGRQQQQDWTGQRLTASRLAPPGCAVSIPRSDCYGWDLDDWAKQTRLAAEDHRYEGAVAGFLLLGIGTYILVNELCNSSDSSGDCGGNAVMGGIGVGALGALLGALIGAQIPKESDEERTAPSDP